MSGDFELDLKAFAAKVGKLADGVVAGTIADLASIIDERSPVGDAKYWKRPPPPGDVGGHYRANWQVGVDARPSGVIAGHNYSVTVGAAKAEIPAEASGHIYYLVNNVPYAWAIEDGTATPRQAPQGVAGRTVIEFKDIVARRVASMAS